MNRIEWLGQNGGDLVKDTNAHSGKWFAIQIIEEAIFSAMTDPTMDLSGTLAAFTFPAGLLIFGSFTDFTLASGAVLAYKLPE